MTQYRFNGKTLDTRTRYVEDRDGQVHLPPKPYRVLVELLEASGRIVTREQLLERVWPERPASDETLSRTVADLRKCLDDDPRSPRYVETIPKVGYRIVGDIHVSSSNAGSRRRGMVAGAAAIVMVVLLLAVLFYDRRDMDAVMDQRGILQAPVPLTTETGDEDTPDFSPDGRWLVYAARDAGDENWDIRLREVDTGTTRDLVTGPDREYAPSFSPDGSRIAFLRYRGERCQVLVKPLQGQERRLVDCRTPMMSYLDWSPDGRHIVYSDTRRGGSRQELRLLDVASGASRSLEGQSDQNGHQFAARYSPDGGRIAFLQGSFDDNEIWIFDRDTGRSRQATELNGWVTGLTWARPGEGLLFTTSRPEPALWRRTESGDVIRLRPLDAYLPAFDPVHDRLVFDHTRLRTNIWSMARTGTGQWHEPERRVASTRIDSQPSLSPDAARLAFVTDRSGAAEVWIAGPQGEAARRLTSLNATLIDRPAWHPDGDRLVYSALVEGEWQSFLHALDGSPPQRLGTGPVRHPVWSENESWVLYAARDGIRRHSPLDGRDESLVATTGTVPLFQSRGALYYLEPDEKGIQVLESGGQERTLLPGFDLVVPAAIAYAEGIIYFIAASRDDSQRWIHGFDLASGALTRIRTVISSTRQAQLSVSPDGRQIFFSQTDDAESDLELLSGPF